MPSSHAPNPQGPSPGCRARSATVLASEAARGCNAYAARVARSDAKHASRLETSGRAPANRRFL
jgi:hypothetical protein